MAVVLKRRRFTLEEYHRMGETGILDEDERVELIEGEIVEMTPIGRPHASVVARLTRLFSARFADRAIVWVQNPLALPRQVSEFQPDLALLKPRPDFYRGEGVEPNDALLVVEVMDSSVTHDRRVKLPIYARGGVPEVWLVNVNDDTVDVRRDPTPDGYRDRHLVGRAGTIAALAFPDALLPVQDVVGSAPGRAALKPEHRRGSGHGHALAGRVADDLPRPALPVAHNAARHPALTNTD